MARPKTDSFWLREIAKLVDHDPELTATQIEARLQECGRLAGRNDWPASRTIRELKKQLVDHAVAYFRWPNSVDGAAFGWSDGAAALDLLAIFGRHHRRPTTRLAKWYCRLRATTTDLPREGLCAAVELANAELLGDSRDAERMTLAVEAWLVLGPWRSPEAALQYHRAEGAGEVHARRLGWVLPPGLNRIDAEDMIAEYTVAALEVDGHLGRLSGSIIPESMRTPTAVPEALA